MKDTPTPYSHRRAPVAGRSPSHRHAAGFAAVASDVAEPALTFRHARDGRLLDISATCRILLGYPPEELLGHSLYGLIHPNDRSCVREAHRLALTERLSQTLCYRLRCYDGSFRWVEARQGSHDPGGVEALRELRTVAHLVTAPVAR
jgi:PAS domain S-box-containing protein